MVVQPTGTVTLLFTDVEGSTQLLERLGVERFAEVLDLHRRVLREAFAHHGGYEVDEEGDAFLVAFQAAGEAVAAAREAQQGLSSVEWPHEGGLRVRMGVHSGEPLPVPPKYVGMDVHRAARIMAAGHGGQVLLSAATQALVDGGVTNLGEHRLKDFAEPVAIYQLGEESFPPLKTISNTNLPRPGSSFVGREQQQEEVVDALQSGTRLLTLTGPGGSGKTRLALEAAGELVPSYKAGVFWVGLASLREPSLVLETITQTLGARDGLVEHIGEREMLLLLDNLEQVIEAASDLSALVAACPNLALLVTSRELLRVQGEVEYAVPPLASSEAVDLFCERSRLEASEEIAELCARLDDLPLAVELAAARTRALSPAQILERLSDRLDLLKGGRDAEARQQTLRATIAWSYHLLSPDEQRVFRALAVFAGGCTLVAVEDVVGTGLDSLQSLVEKSLLRFTNERYWMLETIREYAAEQLDHQGDGDNLRQCQADYFLRLAEESEPHLTGSQQAAWLERLQAEHENLRLSLESLRDAGRGADELRLVGTLTWFWWRRGHLREGSVLAEEALAAHDDQSPGRLKALSAAALLAHRLGNYEQAEALGQERLRLARRLDDPEAVASSLIGVAASAYALGDHERAAAAWAESAEIARAGGFLRTLAVATDSLGGLAEDRGDYPQARAHLEEALTLFRQMGDEGSIAGSLFNLGVVALGENKNNEAEALLHESIELARRMGNKEGAIHCAGGLAALAASTGDIERAARLTGAIETLREETGHAPQYDERRLNEQTRNTLASELDEEQLAAALAIGRAMTFDQVVDYALHTADTSQPPV